MEDRQAQKHRLDFEERRKGSLTGVLDVISFDGEQIFLETTKGILIIRGKELHVSRLQLEQGEVDVDGVIDSLQYSEGTHGKKPKENLLKRMFQ